MKGSPRKDCKVHNVARGRGRSDASMKGSPRKDCKLKVTLAETPHFRPQ